MNKKREARKKVASILALRTLNARVDAIRYPNLRSNTKEIIKENEEIAAALGILNSYRVSLQMIEEK